MKEGKEEILTKQQQLAKAFLQLKLSTCYVITSGIELVSADLWFAEIPCSTADEFVCLSVNWHSSLNNQSETISPLGQSKHDFDE